MVGGGYGGGGPGIGGAVCAGCAGTAVDRLIVVVCGTVLVALAVGVACGC